jgi:hypothetical protein
MGDCAELLLYLLQDGTAKDDLDQNKRTPLSWAAQYSALRAVKILVDNGAEINSMDHMYTTPLSWLIQVGRGPYRAATMDYLRSNGATRRGATRASIKRKIIPLDGGPTTLLRGQLNRVISVAKTLCGIPNTRLPQQYVLSNKDRCSIGP